jgi:hypothetical protein
MWIVTIDAAFALPPAARQIPVAVHTAMRTMLVIARLRRMALRAQGLDFCERK